MAQKSDGENREKGGWGGGGGGLNSGIQIDGLKNKTKTNKSNLGKGRRLPVPNIQGDEWENQSTRGNPLVGCRENPMN